MLNLMTNVTVNQANSRRAGFDETTLMHIKNVSAIRKLNAEAPDSLSDLIGAWRGLMPIFVHPVDTHPYPKGRKLWIVHTDDLPTLVDEFPIGVICSFPSDAVRGNEDFFTAIGGPNLSDAIRRSNVNHFFLVVNGVDDQFVSIGKTLTLLPGLSDLEKTSELVSIEISGDLFA